MENQIPIFALNTVLVPGGTLDLKVFEPRYLDMVSRCLRAETPFGVCAIASGQETGATAQVHGTGTLATISEWDRLPGGLLGITAIGGDRFRIRQSAVQADGLRTAQVDLLVEEVVAVPGELAHLAGLLAQLRPDVAKHTRDAGNLAWRLAEALPLPLELSQQLLETDSGAERLERLETLLRKLAEIEPD
ncbi:MAG: LON peptidase substrate-binding domain-containing protein [Gammaproteobacteria bacterium]|jgi:hypothetical protein|nr:LON peptidase substrate-binding domain-containing protein [Gammaproteobacteria bacterium]